MLILKIAEPELSVLMAKLFKEDTFDMLEVRGLEVITFTSFSITGTLDKTFDDSPQEGTAHCSWSRLKPFALAIIKGKKRPRSIKLTLSHPQASQIHPNASALFLNLNYENNEAHLNTAVAQRSFTLDKSVENAWDDHINTFLKKHNIPITTHL